MLAVSDLTTLFRESFWRWRLVRDGVSEILNCYVDSVARFHVSASASDVKVVLREIEVHIYWQMYEDLS